MKLPLNFSFVLDKKRNIQISVSWDRFGKTSVHMTRSVDSGDANSTAPSVSAIFPHSICKLSRLS